MTFVHSAKNNFDCNFGQTYLENYIINHFEILYACLLYLFVSIDEKEELMSWVIKFLLISEIWFPFIMHKMNVSQSLFRKMRLPFIDCNLFIEVPFNAGLTTFTVYLVDNFFCLTQP